MKSALVKNLFIISSLISIGYADVCQVSPGDLYCGQGTVQTLPEGGFGRATLAGTNVTYSTTISAGSVGVSNGALTKVNISAGSIEVNNEHLQSGINLAAGEITINSSIVQSDMTAGAQTICLASSTTQSINVKTSAHIPTIQLTAGTKVNGNIIFDSPGKVCIDNSSNVTGKITNAQIVHGTCEPE